MSQTVTKKKIVHTPWSTVMSDTKVVMLTELVMILLTEYLNILKYLIRIKSIIKYRLQAYLM